jgi:predicted RNase H-like HicB family nuclease
MKPNNNHKQSMLYPVYIHLGDATHAHGVSFPDFKGCYSAADTWEELPAQIQEAVETHFMDGEPVPTPSKIEHLSTQAEYQNGVWMLANIDLSKLNTKSKRLNISLPSNVVADIDDYAKRHHMSRSAFITKAAMREMTAV